MAIEDQIKWDQKYKESPTLLTDREPSKKLQKIVGDIKVGKALEIACGTGRNSLFLANKGFTVEALDISSVALQFLDDKKHENIHTQLVDLKEYKPKKNSYDIIVKTNYLDRDIIPYLLDALKQNGILFIETYMEHKSNTKPGSNPDFLLKEGELKNFVFNGFKILGYDEFDNEPFEKYRMKKQSIIIKKLRDS